MTGEEHVFGVKHWNYLTAIWGVDCIVHIGGVTSQLLQHLARLDAMHSYEAIIGAAEHMRAIS